ncbi:MAG: sulfite exporter TauE/SafE family protein [Clostridia bacterium]|nr:sulfite exporter TauE/SafE family protein [Clostridia bacterium]
MKARNNTSNPIKRYDAANKKYPPQIIALGILAGFVNGLAGACGGIVMVFAVSYAAKMSGAEMNENETLASSLAAMIPVGAFALLCSGAASPDAHAAICALPAFAGGAIGALIARKIKGASLRTVFAAVTLVAGINMIAGA